MTLVRLHDSYVPMKEMEKAVRVFERLALPLLGVGAAIDAIFTHVYKLRRRAKHRGGGLISELAVVVSYAEAMELLHATKAAQGKTHTSGH